jgi:2'-5' RNA ligase
MSGTTALYVSVAPAARVVRRASGRSRPRLLHRPQPPHVTVLWPFLPAARLDADTRRAVAEVVSALPAFSARFGRVGHFPAVVYLAPNDPEPFVRMTKAVVERWPECPPYEGAFADVIPHVTLRWAPELRRGTTLDDLLPVDVRITHVHLAVDRRWRGWTTIESFPLQT